MYLCSRSKYDRCEIQKYGAARGANLVAKGPLKYTVKHQGRGLPTSTDFSVKEIGLFGGKYGIACIS